MMPIRPTVRSNTKLNADLLESLRKLLGLPPHNYMGNLLYGDGHYAQQLKNKYGEEDYRAGITYLHEREAEKYVPYKR